MKHIQRKFLNERQIADDESIQHIDGFKWVAGNDMSKLKDINFDNETKIFLRSESGKLVEAFYINIDGTRCFIPEPDPVLIFFDSAQRQLSSINSAKRKMVEDYGVSENPRSLNAHNAYVHFELCTVFIISLFTSIETFINRQIPDEYVYEEKKSNRTESFDKEQIQRHISFDVKIKKVLPDAKGKSFEKSHRTNYQFIQNLKEFRDSIIHAKTTKGDNTYSDLFKKAIKFRYDDTLYAVKDFLNYYSENLVEDCPCGADF